MIFAKPVVQQDSYDILKDLWSIPANVTYDQLFQDLEYKAQIIKAFEKDLELVQALIPKQQRLLQPLKIYIKIAGTSLSILINIEASVYVISKDLIKKFKLKVEANDRIKVAPLGRESKVKIIGLISNVPIAIQNLCISRLLYVMGETESIVILKTDWIDWYQADIRRSDNIMKVWINDKKAKIGF